MLILSLTVCFFYFSATFECFNTKKIHKMIPGISIFKQIKNKLDKMFSSLSAKMPPTHSLEEKWT